MNQSARRKLSDGRSGVSRENTSKSDENEGKSGASSFSLLSSPSKEEEPRPENSTESSKLAGSCREAQCGSSSDEDAEKTLVITVDSEQICTRQSGKAKGGVKRKREISETGSRKQDENELQPEVEIDRELDRELENKSRQHNLTSANVRSIIHEVITNEHVVAMMKAAINETESVPLFEPKMTRSKMKEVVKKGVVIPTWNMSPIKKPSKVQGPQFVDIPLEEEDSSDEEYRPDEEEEDETAEDTLLESDLESSASSPRGTRLSLNRSHSECDVENSYSPRQSSHRSQHVWETVVPMGPPPPPQGPEPPLSQIECSFMEKLYAVDEELAIGSDCMDSYQSLTSTGAEGAESLMAFRTRSKRPLRNVPLGRLEAELRAPDITPDMYEFGSAPEDREWTGWLQGLMNSDVENEEEGDDDDDDDPEYNFLADIDEPDVEDYRNDKAVRITKKEVNELMEELFDTFQDELGGQDEEGHEEEEKEEEDNVQHEPSSVLETIQYEDPLADILNQRYRTVKEQLDAIRKRKALLESKGVSLPPKRPTHPPSLYLGPSQKLHLQQHIQQHVQLLTQVNMLSRSVEALETEAFTTRQFLSELQFFAQQGEQVQQVMKPGFVSIFRVCNLQSAVSLLEELDQRPKSDTQNPYPVFPGSQIPADLAWLMVTRRVFLYPQLLPTVRMRPFSQKGPFTSAEKCLLVLGHQHLKGTVNPLKLTSQYLLVARNVICLRVYIRSACLKQRPNFIKSYFLEGKCPPMPLACEKVCPGKQSAPVEREMRLMPRWLSENLELIHEEVQKYNLQHSNVQHANAMENSALNDESPSPSYSFPSGTRYPPSLPDSLTHTLKPWHLPRRTSCRKKAPCVPSSHTTTKSQPTLSTKYVEKALSHLPPLLPKLANQNVEPYPNVHAVSKTQRSKCRTKLAKCAGKTRVATNEGKPKGNQGKLVMLPSAPVTHTGETLIPGSGDGKVQRNVIMALPTALIDPTPSATLVAQTPSSFTSVVKGMSQHSGTLLKLSMGQRTDLGNLSVPSQFILLPSGYIVANSSNVTPNHGAHCQKFSVDPEAGLQVHESLPENFPESKAISQASNGQCNDVQENNETEMKSNETELECGDNVFRERFLTLSESSGSPAASFNGEDDAIETIAVRETDSVEKDRQSTSPTSSSRQQNEQPCWSEKENDEREDAGMQQVKSKLMANITLPEPLTAELCMPDFQETIEQLSKAASDPGEKRLSREEKSDRCATEEDVPESVLLYDDLSDHDPQRDVKDVAFAQAYLEKVCEALQVVPGKVEDFLSVLYEFERNPDGRTGVELFMKLKPVLRDWPELLRDFAAFLHPEQAQECGLLKEQQAFERSRRFLRQLERSFGENSIHYRKVVHTLQRGLPKTHSGSEEMKTRIALLFRDHPHLLEEYWVFYEQLQSTMEPMSDEEEDEMEADSMPNAYTVHNVEEGQEEDQTTQSCIQNTDAIIPSTKSCCTGTVMMEKQSRDDAQSQLKASQIPVCAKNSSRMPSGEKVVLWTREADRVILTTCQQRGASQSTFLLIAEQLGNKSVKEVGTRYHDLMKLFHKAASQQPHKTVSSDEKPD